MAMRKDAPGLDRPQIPHASGAHRMSRDGAMDTVPDITDPGEPRKRLLVGMGRRRVPHLHGTASS